MPPTQVSLLEGDSQYDVHVLYMKLTGSYQLMFNLVSWDFWRRLTFSLLKSRKTLQNCQSTEFVLVVNYLVGRFLPLTPDKTVMEDISWYLTLPKETFDLKRNYKTCRGFLLASDEVVAALSDQFLMNNLGLLFRFWFHFYCRAHMAHFLDTTGFRPEKMLKMTSRSGI